MTIRFEIDARVTADLAAAHSIDPPHHSLAPFRPCPLCPGVLREDAGALWCWTCGCSLTDKGTGAKKST